MTESASLRRLGAAALRWIESSMSNFELSDPGNDFVLVQEMKPIAELALACDVLRRGSGAARLRGPFARFPRFVLAKCWGELDEGEHVRLLLLKYPDLFSLVTVYPPFRRAGFVNDRLEETIESISKDPSVRALEFPAWRLIDFSVALHALGVRSQWNPQEEFGRTWLGQTPPPWMMSDSAAYSLTHTIFSMTDFGLALKGLPKRARVYVSQWFPVWTRYYARARNYDLLGELLMVAYCLRLNETEEPLKKLLAGQRRNGAVVGPEATLSSLGTAGRRTSRRQQFLRHYHTTLVALMASALGLQVTSDSVLGRLRG